MTKLKRIVVIVSGIITLIFIAALFTKKEYTVERSLVIDAPLDSVFGYIALLKNQNNYSKWALIDPMMETYFKGEDGTPGFISGWKSENPEVGEGEQEILALEPNTQITYELRFFKPFSATSLGWMNTEAVNEARTQVTWGIKGKMNYPSNIMLWFFDMEDMLANDFDIGLANMKNLLEADSN